MYFRAPLVGSRFRPHYFPVIITHAVEFCLQLQPALAGFVLVLCHATHIWVLRRLPLEQVDKLGGRKWKLGVTKKRLVLSWLRPQQKAHFQQFVPWFPHKWWGNKAVASPSMSLGLVTNLPTMLTFPNTSRARSLTLLSEIYLKLVFTSINTQSCGTTAYAIKFYWDHTPQKIP